MTRGPLSKFLQTNAFALIVVLLIFYYRDPDSQLDSATDMAMASRSFALNRTIFNKELYSRMQAFWFADHPPEQSHPDQALMERWFGLNEAKKEVFDQKCHEEFSEALHAISPDKLKLPPFASWKEERSSALDFAAPFLKDITPNDPHSNEDVETASSNALSIVLLLDQMPRNIFRNNQKLIYTHYDRLSQALVHTITSRQPRLDLAPHIRYMPVKRTWFYVPLMHSESLEDHEELLDNVKSMESAAATNGEEDAAKYCQTTLNFEERHVDIIRQFGRYPYRNKAIGRETTAEEEKWLATGETFGAG